MARPSARRFGNLSSGSLLGLSELTVGPWTIQVGPRNGTSFTNAAQFFERAGYMTRELPSLDPGNLIRQ